MRILPAIAACLRCNRGAAMTEFVLIVPMMALMLAGAVEVTGLLRLDRKLQNAAYATADLSTQRPNLSDTRLADIFAAADLVIQPYIDQDLSIGISSVVFDPDDGSASVDWSESLRGGTVPDATEKAVGMGPPGTASSSSGRAIPTSRCSGRLYSAKSPWRKLPLRVRGEVLRLHVNSGRVN